MDAAQQFAGLGWIALLSALPFAIYWLDRLMHRSEREAKLKAKAERRFAGRQRRERSSSDQLAGDLMAVIVTDYFVNHR